MEIIFVRHGQSTENIALETESDYNANNIILTEQGKIQANKTGEYLRLYGIYDKIYSSKLTRCVETANIIKEHVELNDSEIEFTDLIYEVGENSDLKIISPLERKIVTNKINERMSAIENEKNVFTRLRLLTEFEKIEMSNLHFDPSIEKQFIDIKDFLEVIKNSNYQRILVVCHGGTIATLQSIITNIPRGADAHIMVRKQTTKTRNPEPTIELNNCLVMCVLLENNIFHIVSAPNNLHLK